MGCARNGAIMMTWDYASALDGIGDDGRDGCVVLPPACRSGPQTAQATGNSFPAMQQSERAPVALNTGCDGIIGSSSALRDVLGQIRRAAPTDCTILIEGETGTGKELVARAIHTESGRRDRPFVKLNCAAVPPTLFESELFGHEKGAFTGAVMRKVGRFEAAEGGTLFLDEIGDIPPDLQCKLLRVLQEREFERVGSTHSHKANVRIVAATNAILPKLISEKRFRSDLFYRLNVFPISVPSLRDRREDIPLLVRHFVSVYSERLNKKIESIPGEVMDTLLCHSWPGNIRELQHVIERTVILTDGRMLRNPSFQLCPTSGTEPLTLKDSERAHILNALRRTNWVVGGRTGAAAQLGLKRTTLIAKMRRLCLSREPAHLQPA